MATDLKTIRKEVYCTPLDVYLLGNEEFRAVTHSNNIFMGDPRIEMAILRATGLLDGILGMVTDLSNLAVTPYSSPIIEPRADEDGAGENTGSGILYGVQINSTAYTEKWTLTFTSETDYNISGSVSGEQGTGVTSSDSNSTNNDITIPSDVWSGTPASGDKFEFASYKYNTFLTTLCTMLATGLTAKSVYGAEAPTAAPMAIQFYSDAMEIINDICNGNKELPGFGASDIDTAPMMAGPFEVDIYGYDVSNYREDDDFQRLKQGESPLNLPWWVVN